jgi:hypothetical protein
MSYGFVTTRPGSVSGGNMGSCSSGLLIGQRIGIEAVGVWNITEIGTWGHRYLNSPAVIDMRLYTNDFVNGCPETLITNSSSGNLSWTETDPTIKYASLSGVYIDTTTYHSYWIVSRTQDANFMVYGTTPGQISFIMVGDWPTDPDVWHLVTKGVTDYANLYAVYSPYSIRTLFRP